MRFLGNTTVNGLKTPYFVLKTRFMRTIAYNAMKALGNVQTR